MAHSKHPIPEHRAKVAAHIGHLMARNRLGVSSDAKPELAESFEIYLLRVEDIARGWEERGLAKIIQPTGQWHHQIHADGKPFAFARSALSDQTQGEWSVQSLFRSELAAKFARVIQHVDKERAERETELKLFSAPAYHLYAFLLEHSRESHVLVIDSPFAGLKSGTEISEADFLARLQALRPIQGLVPPKSPSITIAPRNLALTEMKSVVFRAYDGQGSPVAVNWSIAPSASGKIVPPSVPASSATYTAPQQISEPQAVEVTATAGPVSASTTVFLTPVTVQVMPSAVQLKHNQAQQFIASVSGDPTNSVRWLLSPEIGQIDGTGLYTPKLKITEKGRHQPSPEITDSMSLRVIAVSALGAKSGSAAVTLLPPPWARWKTNLLGFYLLAVFALIFLLVALWPPAGPDPLKTAKRQDAQTKVDTDNDTIKKLQDASAAAAKATPSNSVRAAAPDLADLMKLRDEDVAALEAAKKEETASADPLDHPGASKFADRPGAFLPRDIDLLFLVLIGGALGAFLHATKSFTAFVGNEQLKGSWAWWYYLHPFLGAILAVAFYVAIRGGFMAVTSGTAIKTSEVSAFALTSVAVVVGMFSKNAINKLGDVFETLFLSSSSKNLKNPLTPSGGAASAIKVLSINPNAGLAAGGTSVTVTGNGFANGATLTIGGVAATNTNYVSATSITGVTGAHTVGSADVEVANPTGEKSALPNAFRYF